MSQPTKITAVFAIFCGACGAGQGQSTAGGEGAQSAAESPGRGETQDPGTTAVGSGDDAASDTPVGQTASPSTGGPQPLPAGTKVLHVGDSFAGALGKPLGELLEKDGVRSILKHTDSSYLTDWAWDGKLQEYIWKYNPDLILITLGANELEIEKPELRERTVKKIIETVGKRPCVWVAIPLWAGPKNGLLDVIRGHAQPCVYMDTNTLVDVAAMPRMKDGIHPTTEARSDWADFVHGWLKTHRTPAEGRPWNIAP